MRVDDGRSAGGEHLLESYSGIQSTDSGEARAALFGSLGAVYFDLPAHDREFALNLHWSKREDLTLVSAKCTVGTDVRYSPATFVRQYFEMSAAGHFKFFFKHGIAELTRDAPPVIVPDGTDFRVQSTASHDLLVLRIDQKVLNRKLQSLLGEEVGGDVIFDPPTGQDNPRQQSLRQAVVQLAFDLDMFGPDMPTVARAELEQAAIVKFLLCNDHNFSSRLAERHSSPSASQLRLVEDYIEANWDKPLDLETLARISNVSARTLFRYFRTIRGTSPRDFVKTVRLRQARKLIQGALPNASVMSIAMRCGFQSLGHFSRDYRKAFGELPSETLRRSRRPRRH